MNANKISHLLWVTVGFVSLNLACNRAPSSSEQESLTTALTVESLETGTTPRMALVSDGNTTGNEHFFFLPPTVLQQRKANGAFDPAVQPEVKICALDVANNLCISEVALFNSVSGPLSERVQLKKDHYAVNWHTKDLPSYSDIYRIQVLLKGRELGYADVKFTRSLSNLIMNVIKDYRKDKTIDYAYVMKGKTLPIKFRIEKGALPAVSDAEAPRYSIGRSHTCTLDALGDVWCAGWNALGQVGNGEQNLEVLYPVKVIAPVSFTAVAAGDRHTCALDTNKQAWCWGSNQFNQLGSPTPDTYFATSPQLVSGGVSFDSISTGNLTTCGIDTAGKAWCWGYGGYGNIGDGLNTYAQLAPVQVPVSTVFKSIVVSTYHVCALGAAQEAYCWGYNIDGVLGNGQANQIQSTPGLVQGALKFNSLSLNDRSSCGLTPSQQGWCWGSNGSGQLGNGTAEFSLAPLPVSGGLSFKGLASGGSHTCGLDLDGKAYCWGSNTLNQLGTVTAGASFSAQPVAVDGDLLFQTLDAGANQSCALGVDEQIYCWGQNNLGSFGDGGLASGQVPSPSMNIP